MHAAAVMPAPIQVDQMFSSPAFAQTADASSQGSGAGLFFQFFPFLLILVIFYVLMWRPQQLRMKEHRAALDAVKKGDTVVTGGGLIGKVTRVDEGEVEIELGPNTRVKALKSTLSEVRAVAGKPAND
jgi:preprotein translocase subunit YajC